MDDERTKPATTIVRLGIAAVTVGLVMQTFADTAGLYCFAIGVVLILIYILLKAGELLTKKK